MIFLAEVTALPKKKQNLNTVYISERLRETLRPISGRALTAVTAPMGYGKTTAVSCRFDGTRICDSELCCGASKQPRNCGKAVLDGGQRKAIYKSDLFKARNRRRCTYKAQTS